MHHGFDQHKLISRFANRILPLSGVSCPISILNNVDFPAPFGPMIPTIAPGGILKLKFSNSTLSPKRLLTGLPQSRDHPGEDLVEYTIPGFIAFLKFFGI